MFFPWKGGGECVRLGCGVADLNSDPSAKREETRRSWGWQESAERQPGLRRALTEMFKDRAARPCLPHVCGRVCVWMCARVRVRAPRASLASRGKADAPRRGSLGASVGVLSAPEILRGRSRQRRSRSCGRAVAYTRLGRSTLQPPLMPAKGASLQLRPADPTSLAPGGHRATETGHLLHPLWNNTASWARWPRGASETPTLPQPLLASSKFALSQLG